ncbi:hypothetical protein MJO29_004920, partial [Puccinia striiformis f. sp. tritici]
PLETVSSTSQAVVTKTMATCTRLGCGKKFDPNQNLESHCVFHPGKTVFHEGLKSLSCCKEKNKPVMEFDQFMKIEGCVTGIHSLEKPPVFHKGSKGYSCCKKRVLDFNDFLRLRGCKKSSHLFTDTYNSNSNGDSNKEEIVESRFDFYQTSTSVIVSIFAKKVNQNQSIIKFDPSGVFVDSKLPLNKCFRRKFNLFGLIGPAQSTYKILTTKCEMVLIKSDGRSWSNLEKGDLFVGTVTFGVGGRIGTAGAKEIVT